jgi:hypothetical protein
VGRAHREAPAILRGGSGGRRSAFLVLAAASFLAAGKSEPKLLFWGANWKDNAPSQSGESWLALRNDGEKSSLVRVTVVVTPQGPNEVRNVMVTLKEGFRPGFLVQGVPELSPGPVRTVFDGLMPLIPHAIVHFSIPISKWSNVFLQAVPGKDAYERGGKKRHKTYDIILHSYGDNPRTDQVTQTLIGYLENPGQTPTLLWAGDIDRDGRVDLLMDLQTAEAAGSFYHLYLSSRAKKGELVGLVATLGDPAC